MAAVRTEYEASEWGTAYHRLTVDEALGAGAAGPGKSMCLLMDPLYDRIPHEHNRCTLRSSDPNFLEWGRSQGWALHLRRTSPMLEQTIQRALRIFPQVDPGVRYQDSKRTFIFSSGYRYQFDHCQHSGDWQKYMSNQYDWIGFDELIQFEKDQYDNIVGRLRSGDPLLDQMLKARAMSNPSHARTAGEKFSVDNNPNWVRDYFVAPYPRGGKVLKQPVTRADGRTDVGTRIYLRATLYHNPDKAFVDRFEKNLLLKPKHIQRALLYGDWWITSDAFFSEAWDPDIHICKPFKIPKGWPIWRSMDWGFKAPGCIHWYAMDPDGNVYVIYEYKFQGQVVDEVCDAVKQIEKTFGWWGNAESKLSGPADDQLWERRGEGGKDKAEIFAENGILWVKADKRSRATNAGHVTARLLDHDRGRSIPGLVFFDRCNYIIVTLPGMQEDPKNPEAPAKGGDDHGYDSLAYGIAHASYGIEGISSTENWWEDDSEGEVEQSLGSDGYGALY